MPLDPLVKGFLDSMGAVPGPKMWELPANLARQAFDGLMQLVGPKDVPVGKIENLSIPRPGGTILARSYAPVALGSEPQPVLVYYHGGGFVIGNLESHDGLCRMFANEGGFRVIAVDYRLSPEHKFPAAIDDAYAALVWIEANATTLGVDANRIAVGGDSAGGQLAAAVCQIAREKNDPKIAFQLLMFPVTQMDSETPSLNEYAVGYFLEKKTLEWFYGSYLPEGVDKSQPKISPLRAKDLASLPPAYIMLGGYDPLHDEGLAYAEKLRGASVRVTIADYADMVHCFIYLQTVLPQAREAVADAAKAVRDALAAS